MKKIKPEDVASELRLLSKNWCLSPEVINIISHGYERICELERERDEARREAAKFYAQPVLQRVMRVDRMSRIYAEECGWDCFIKQEDGK
jgi:hypothetical protein